MGRLSWYSNSPDDDHPDDYYGIQDDPEPEPDDGEEQMTQPTQAAPPNALDQAWEQINALGGAPTDECSTGYNEAIGHALDVIERLGGMNPDIRSASPGVQRAYWAFRTKSAIYEMSDAEALAAVSPEDLAEGRRIVDEALRKASR